MKWPRCLFLYLLLFAAHQSDTFNLDVNSANRIFILKTRGIEKTTNTKSSTMACFASLFSTSHHIINSNARSFSLKNEIEFRRCFNHSNRKTQHHLMFSLCHRVWSPLNERRWVRYLSFTCTTQSSTVKSYPITFPLFVYTNERVSRLLGVHLLPCSLAVFDGLCVFFWISGARLVAIFVQMMAELQPLFCLPPSDFQLAI